MPWDAFSVLVILVKQSQVHYTFSVYPEVIMSAIYTLGIDVGSTASKCIMRKDGQEIVAKSLIDVVAGTSGPQRAIDAVL